MGEQNNKKEETLKGLNFDFICKLTEIREMYHCCYMLCLLTLRHLIR